MPLSQDPTFVPIDQAIAQLDVATVDEAFAELARVAAADTGLSAAFLHERLQQQGARARAPLGDGVKIAHLRVPQLAAPYVVIGRANRRLENADGPSADLFALMISPVRDIAGHLHRLARVTRLFRTDHFRAALRSAPSAKALCEFIGLAERESQAA